MAIAAGTTTHPGWAFVTGSKSSVSSACPNMPAAIAALEGIPSDPGFSLIGRMDRPSDVQTPSLESGGLTDVDRDLMAYAQKA